MSNAEVIDMDDPSFSCTHIDPLPKLSYATGGLIDNIPFVCGYSGSNLDCRNCLDCFVLQESGSWSKTITNQSDRTRIRKAGWTVIKDKLIIVGYSGKGKPLSTIKMVSITNGSRILNARLPVALCGSCVVPWLDNTFMVIGGQGLAKFCLQQKCKHAPKLRKTKIWKFFGKTRPL